MTFSPLAVALLGEQVDDRGDQLLSLRDLREPTAAARTLAFLVISRRTCLTIMIFSVPRPGIWGGTGFALGLGLGARLRRDDPHIAEGWRPSSCWAIPTRMPCGGAAARLSQG